MSRNIEFERTKNKYKKELVDMLKELTEEEWVYLFDNSMKYWKEHSYSFHYLRVGEVIHFAWAEPRVMRMAYNSENEIHTADFNLSSLILGYFNNIEESEVRLEVWIAFLIEKFGNRYIKLALRVKQAILETRIDYEKSILKIKLEYEDTKKRWGENLFEEFADGKLEDLEAQLKTVNGLIMQMEEQAGQVDAPTTNPNVQP